MSKAKPAKTASKNNPNAREKAKKIHFNGKEVKPVLYIGANSKYMAVQYDDGSGQMAVDHNGIPLPWAKTQA
jgi:hypothetical protein